MLYSYLMNVLIALIGNLMQLFDEYVGFFFWQITVLAVVSGFCILLCPVMKSKSSMEKQYKSCEHIDDNKVPLFVRLHDL